MVYIKSVFICFRVQAEICQSAVGGLGGAAIHEYHGLPSEHTSLIDLCAQLTTERKRVTAILSSPCY